MSMDKRTVADDEFRRIVREEVASGQLVVVAQPAESASTGEVKTKIVWVDPAADPVPVSRLRGPRFVVRTIRNSRVRVQWATFRCDNDASRFESQRAVFGVYYDEYHLISGITLWGSVEMHRAKSESDFAEAYTRNPFSDNGVLRWESWTIESCLDDIDRVINEYPISTHRPLSGATRPSGSGL